LASLEERLQSCDLALSPAERLVLKGCWEGKTYPEIAEQIGYAETTIKNNIGPESLKKVSEALGRKTNKKTLIANIRECLSLEESQTELSSNSATESKDNDIPDFVGRQDDFAVLDRFRSRGTKAVLIWGEWGIGKTQTASHYLKHKFGSKILDFRLTRDERMTTSIEYEIQAKLRGKLQEEPGQEFEVSLDRFKTRLRNESWGVWIDNLEPLLDEQGKILEKHWKYKVFLEQVACDPLTQSFFVITSRELLCEGLDLETYKLSSLSIADWSEYFDVFEDQPDAYKVLSEMHRYFGGNALAMKNIRQSASEYRKTGLMGYWKDYPYQDRSDSRENVKDLIKYQFDRLKLRNFNAYNLLCRMGCFRYQESAVPHEALQAILWDIEENDRRSIIFILKSSGLIEVEDGEFVLHPYIHEEANLRLKKNSHFWERSHLEAAAFWQSHVTKVVKLEDALKVLESYYHYLEVQSFEKAGEVLISRRESTWGQTRSEALGIALYRLGLSQKCIKLIRDILPFVNKSLLLSGLYNIIGDCYWLTGNLHEAISAHQRCRTEANIFLDSDQTKLLWKDEFFSKKRLIHSLFNIGLCKIELYELVEAKYFFESCLQESRKYFKNVSLFSTEQELEESIEKPEDVSPSLGYSKTPYLEMIVNCNSYLAFLVSSQEKEKAKVCLRKALLGINSKDCMLSTWGRGYIPIYMGISFGNIGLLEKAISMLEDVIQYANSSSFWQAKAKALIAMAEIRRKQNSFDTALELLAKAILLCKQVSAKCDLAEAYLQQGITSKEIGEYEQAAYSFAEAERIWKAIDAPRQLERLELIRKGN